MKRRSPESARYFPILNIRDHSRKFAAKIP